MRILAAVLMGITWGGPLVAQANYRPTVQLTDLMGLRFFHTSGLFQFDGAQITFPKPDASYTLVLRQAGASGATIYSTGLRLESVSGFPVFGWLAPLERGSDKFKLTAGGAYELAIRMGSQDLTVVPFQAEAIPSGDAFNPGTSFRLNGPWDQVAYLYAKDGDPNARLHAVGWVGDREFGATREDRWVTVQVSRGGAAFCKSEVFVDAPHWSRYRFDLAKANNAQCTLADITKADGDYVLEFRNKVKLLRSFGFKVVGNKIQRIPRNTVEYLANNWGGIPGKLVNSDLHLLETFWFDVSRGR